MIILLSYNYFAYSYIPPRPRPPFALLTPYPHVLSIYHLDLVHLSRYLRPTPTS